MWYHRLIKRKGKPKMIKLFRKKESYLYKVKYKFVGENEIYTTTCTSGGLASLLADFGVEIVEVK
jgi:hypothetical protein